jgi:hypothetical protein
MRGRSQERQKSFDLFSLSQREAIHKKKNFYIAKRTAKNKFATSIKIASDLTGY